CRESARRAGGVRLSENEVAAGGGVGRATAGDEQRDTGDDHRRAGTKSRTHWTSLSLGRRPSASAILRAGRQWAIRRCGTTLSPQAQGVKSMRSLLPQPGGFRKAAGLLSGVVLSE